MADLTQWVGVVGAGIGGLFTFLASSIGSVVKHFSEVRQKKLERKWKLEDSEQESEAKRRIDELQAMSEAERFWNDRANKLRVLKAKVGSSETRTDWCSRLKEFSDFFSDGRLLLVDKNRNFFVSYCSPAKIGALEYGATSKMPEPDFEELKKGINRDLAALYVPMRAEISRLEELDREGTKNRSKEATRDQQSQ